MYLLGISAFYHDSAATLIKNGEILAAAQEERFTRKKHDAGFPTNAARYCLAEAGIEITDLTAIVFYDKPLLKFERLLETYLAYAPRGLRSFIAAMPVWLKEKLFLKQEIRHELSHIGDCSKNELPRLLFSEHHQSHAASAFFPSPYEEAAVMCLDGVGEWATTSIWHGKGNDIEELWQINFPHSIGLLYSAFTTFCGFKVNSGEYKLMGLAPYGRPKYVKTILNHLIDLKEDGSFSLDMNYFDFATGLRMTNSNFSKLFGGPGREPESKITQREMDLARSIQEVTEECVLRLARTVQAETKTDSLCLAGGVALNCVANGRLSKEGPFKNIWIQPAAGDAGGSLGAALSAWYQYYRNEKREPNLTDSMKGTYLGPHYSTYEIEGILQSAHARYVKLNEEELASRVAELLADGKVVGWFQGRMEFGPRALGGRSILGDPRNPNMQSQMNLKIKFRESFRPFAPSVLAEHVSEWFDQEKPSPYMLIVSTVRKQHQNENTRTQQQLTGIDLLNIPRSTIPAVTHVDYTARIQTVHRESNPNYYRLINHFYQLTGCPVLINTSFNVRGEPIVCTPGDAYRCFMRTNMDYLVVENFLLSKEDQKPWKEEIDWRKEYELD